MKEKDREVVAEGFCAPDGMINSIGKRNERPVIGRVGLGFRKENTGDRKGSPKAAYYLLVIPAELVLEDAEVENQSKENAEDQASQGAEEKTVWRRILRYGLGFGNGCAVFFCSGGFSHSVKLSGR